MPDERDQVRSRISLVELVGQRVALKRHGKHWKGLCPFHDDRNPSFQVSDVTGTYRCWSCGAKGDVFSWVMETQHVDFRDALEILAKQAGVELSRSPATTAEARSKRSDRESAMLCALGFFQQALALNADARAYCERRGLSDLVLQAWEIGFAPEVPEALPVALKKAGHNLAECRELFLVEGEPHSGYSARFRSRLMFPIRDERGALVAFGGRLLGDGIPKYINSGDTPLYSKRRVLYGMHRAKNAIAQSRRAVLVEGYLDVIACHRAGVEEAVASLGTSLSEEHAQMLRRWSDEVTVLYDSDPAGQKAAERAAEMLQAEGLKVRVSLMPSGEDPDTLLRNLGPEAVKKAASGGLSPMEYRIARIRAEHTPEEDEFWQDMVLALATATSPIELERYLSEVSPEYPGLRDPLAAREALRRQVASARRSLGRSRTSARAETPSVAVSARLPIKASELAVFEALFDESLRADAWAAVLDLGMFATSHGHEIASAIVESIGSDAPQTDPVEWLAQVSPETIRMELADMALAPRSRVNALILADAVADLRRRREEAEVRSMRATGSDDDGTLEQINARLKGLKPKYE